MGNQGNPAEERGAMIALVGVVGAFVVVAAVLLAGLTQRVVYRAQAQAAADAAALAGVVEGEVAARAVALANGAVLVDFVDQGNEVSVIVARSDEVTANATAERRLEAVGGG